MVMAAPQGGRGLRLRVFGFPVHIDVSFFVVMAIFGFSGRNTITGLVAWIAIGAVSILLHELGHAFVARTTGAAPAIALVAFGGVTTYRPPAPLTRARSLAISATGPL